MEEPQGFSSALTGLGGHTGIPVAALWSEVLTLAVGDPRKCQCAVPSPVCSKLLGSQRW